MGTPHLLLKSLFYFTRENVLVVEELGSVLVQVGATLLFSRLNRKTVDSPLLSINID